MTTPQDPWPGSRPTSGGPGVPGQPTPGGGAGHPAPYHVPPGPPPGYGGPSGYGGPPGYGGPSGYGGPPGAPPPGGYGPASHPTPAAHGAPAGPPGPSGWGAPGGYPGPNGYPGAGHHPHQQPGYPAPGSQHAIPPGAPGPIPEWWERFAGRFLDNLMFGVAAGILSSIIGAAFVPTTAEIIANGYRLGYGYYLATAVVYLITGVAFAAYDVVMHARTGQTLGKMALKTRVVTPSGGLADQAALIRRAVVYPASGIGLAALFLLIPGISATGLPLLVSIGYAVAMSVPLFTDPLRRGWHDKWSNTIVIKA